MKDFRIKDGKRVVFRGVSYGQGQELLLRRRGYADDDFDQDHRDGQVEYLKTLATPAAVDLAEEHGIDLSHVSGSGADGKITLADVKANIPPADDDDQADDD